MAILAASFLKRDEHEVSHPAPTTVLPEQSAEQVLSPIPDAQASIGSEPFKSATSTTPHDEPAAPDAPISNKLLTARGAEYANPEVAADMGKIALMFRDFRTIEGENPVGTNAEIMKSIMGGNSRGANPGPPEGMSVNGVGELVDQWGTPFFFHALSKDVMEIRSAGPDKRMWTEDDLMSE